MRRWTVRLRTIVTRDMDNGKDICLELKEVRRKIAEENGIELRQEECGYRGECSGTCPRCEAEVRVLEQVLAERVKMGKVATIAGLALGLSATTLQAQTDVPDNKGIVDTIESRSDLLEGEAVGDESLYVIVDEEPQFPGGQEALERFIKENLLYPKEAEEQGIFGHVYVILVIDTDGTIAETRVVRDIGGGCGEAAKRVVEMMPKWEPGKVQGKAVKTQWVLPIKFVPRKESNK